ncbi:uncharacterized protein METZ01_LOCUS24027 [marine metagenome]|uniref:Uncharacterized protein n=1 Tax=marine metagenome TaxID=408172 RepID=A0A381Q0L1_9ZZZZ
MTNRDSLILHSFYSDKLETLPIKHKL